MAQSTLMKQQLYSSLPLSNSQILNEFERVQKRSSIFICSPTPPPDDNSETEREEEINVDELTTSPVSITEDRSEINFVVNVKSLFLCSNCFSCLEHDSGDDDDDDDDDIIEIESQNYPISLQQTDSSEIFVSDSDSDNDQEIDIIDGVLPSVSPTVNTSMFSSDIGDIEIIREEIDDELVIIDQDEENEHDHESLGVVTNDNSSNSELIDLTEDELIPVSCSTISSDRRSSIDMQQCPICLETVSQLQHTGVYLIITRCRHIMCTLCSRQLLATSSRCPLCREYVSSTTIMPYCILA